MKMTNRELQSKVQILSMISNKQLPIKVSYSIAKNINSINKELAIVESEKQKLIKEYALKDEHGNLRVANNKILFPSIEKENECNGKYNELLDIEVDIELRVINAIDLFKSNVEFSPSELMELDFFIVE